MKNVVLLAALSLVLACSSPVPQSPVPAAPPPPPAKDYPTPDSIPPVTVALPTPPGQLRVRLFYDESDMTYDTLVPYDFLNRGMYSFATFNYPSLQGRTLSENGITLFNDTLSVSITHQKFDSTQHRIMRKAGKVIFDGVTFDNDEFAMPNEEIAQVSITQNGREWKFRKDEIFGHYDLQLEYTDVYLTSDGRIIIWMINSDMYTGYYLVWILKDGKLIESIFAQGSMD